MDMQIRSLHSISLNSRRVGERQQHLIYENHPKIPILLPISKEKLKNQSNYDVGYSEEKSDDK